MSTAINGLVATNIGDGKSIELSWSIVDISFVKYFVIERYDRHKKAWVPYDNFHGVLAAQESDVLSNPPQRIVVQVDDRIPSHQSFRVKSISKSGEHSEWVSASTELEVYGSDIAETNLYYIKEGLAVYHLYSLTVVAMPGIAFLGGFRRQVTNEVSLRLPNAFGESYVVFIKQDGNIDFATEDEFNAIPLADRREIRLARVVVDATGEVHVYDQRFLWAPQGFSVSSSIEGERIAAPLLWQEVEEPNTRGYRIYRANSETEGQIEPPPDEAFQRKAYLEFGITYHEDAESIVANKTYWYKISTVDQGGNESLLSEPIKFNYVDEVIEGMKPSIPQGLQVQSVGSPGEQLYAKLTWMPNPEEEKVHSYRVWIVDREDNSVYPHALVEAPYTFYHHLGLGKGSKMTYAISAISYANGIKLESDLSEHVTVIIGTGTRPVPPEWDPSGHISTGANEEEIWVDLRWLPVLTNEDSTAISDLEKYTVYRIIPDETEESGFYYDKEMDVDKESTEARVIIPKRSTGMSEAYVLTASNIWGNESDYSVPSSEIVVGGRRPEAPTMLDPNVNLEDRTVKLNWTKVTKDIEGESVDIIKYRIYRGVNHLQISFLSEVDATEDEVQSWLDTAIQDNKEYFYRVTAVSSDWNESYGSSPILHVDIPYEIEQEPPPEPPILIDHGSYVDGERIVVFLEYQMPLISSISGTNAYVTSANKELFFWYRGIDWKYNNNSGETYRSEHYLPLSDNGKVLHYALRTVSSISGKMSEWSTSPKVSIQVGDTTVPASPVIELEPQWVVTDNVSDSGIKITWPQITVDSNGNPLEFPGGYNIYRSTSHLLHSFEKVAEVSYDPELSSIEYLDMGLRNKGHYWYYVTCYTKYGVESPLSEEVIKTSHAGRLEVEPAPNWLEPQYTFIGNETVECKLSWEPTPYAKEYEVLKSYTDGGYILAGTTSETTFVDTAAYKQQVYYRVRAIDIDDYKGNLSTPLNAKTTYDVPPLNVEILTQPIVTQVSTVRFDLTVDWTEYIPADPDILKSYSIIVKRLDYIDRIEEVDPSVKSYTVFNLPMRDGYSVAIVANDIYGNSSTPLWTPFSLQDMFAPMPITNLSAKAMVLSNLLTWDPPKTDVAGNPAIDLDGYIVYISSLPMENPAEDYQEQMIVHSNSLLHQAGGNKTFYYAVAAFDFSNNISEPSEVVDSTSLPLSGEEISEQKPAEVTGLIEDEIASGVDLSEVDDTSNVWISFSWDPVDGADKYFVYIDGQFFSQTRKTNFKANGLYRKGSYEVKVSAVSRYGLEGDPSAPLVINTDIDHLELPPPIVKGEGVGTTQYFRGIVVQWKEPIKLNGSKLNHISGYTLQCIESNRSELLKENENWATISHGSKLDYFIHGRLDYSLNYFYRVRVEDTFGNVSPWVYFNENSSDTNYILGIQPAKTGVDDIHFGTVTSEHLAFNSVKGYHVDAESITAKHIASFSLTSDKFAAKSIKGNALDIIAGGANLVNNSAFGMTKLNEDILGIGWFCNDLELTNLIYDESNPLYGSISIIDAVDDQDIPIQGHALQLESTNYNTFSVYQELDIPSFVKEVCLSFYLWTDQIFEEGEGTGLFVDICEKDPVTGELTPVCEYLDSEPTIRFTGSRPWTRYINILRLPEVRSELFLRISLINSYGTARITGVQVEAGDTPTQWYPKDGEIYGAQGSIQINHEGISVYKGKIHIESSDSMVIINGTGITAKHGQSSYASLNAQGFRSVGGKFFISTLSDENIEQGLLAESLSMDAQGIVARDSSGAKTVEIASSGNIYITNGRFLISTSALSEDGSVSNGLIINSDGLKILKDSSPTIELLSSGSVFVRDDFHIAGGRVSITQDGVTARNGSNAITFKVDSLTGNVYMGPNLTLSSKGFDVDNKPIKENSIIIDSLQGIIGHNSAGESTFQLLNDGSAKFKGSLEILSKNTDTERQITITPSGIYGPKDANGNRIFALTDGSVVDEPAGLKIAGAEISQGAVILGEKGMVVKGQDGIVVNDINDNPIVIIDSSGVNIKEHAGLVVSENGSIVVGETKKVVVDKTGVRADSMTAGTLHITSLKDGSDDSSISIKVGGTLDPLTGKILSPNVDIHRDGIDIFNGALNIYGDDGQNVIMQNGKIKANAISVIPVGLNLLRNGTATFTENGKVVFWETFNAKLTQAKTILETGEPIGKSGSTGFRIEATVDGGGISQVLDEDVAADKIVSPIREGIVYSAVWNIYVQSGGALISITNCVDEETEEPIEPIRLGFGSPYYNQGMWHKISFAFKKGSGIDDPKVEIKSIDGPAIIYARDIMVAEGDLPGSYTPHMSELISGKGNVMISDAGIVILSDDGTVKIDNSGISGTNFSLSNEGLKINFKEPIALNPEEDQRTYLQMDETVGIRVTDPDNPSKFTQINQSGLKCNYGHFELTNRGVNGSVIIDGSGLTVKNKDTNPTQWAKISSRGLEIVGGAFLKIASSSSSTSQRTEITTKNVKVFEAGESLPRVVLGILPDEVVTKVGQHLNHGLYVDNGSFYISTGEAGEDYHYMQITPSELTSRRVDRRGNNKFFSLTVDGLLFTHGSAVVELPVHIQVSNSAARADGSTPVLLSGFSTKPKVLVAPAKFRTYYANRSAANQYIKFWASSITRTSFIPCASYSFDQAILTSIDEVGDRILSSGNNATYIATTKESFATSISVTVYCSAEKSSAVTRRGYVTLRAYASYDGGASWTQIGVIDTEGGKWIKGGKHVHVTETFKSSYVSPRKLKVKVVAEECWRATAEVLGVSYDADSSLPVSGPAPTVNWIAVECDPSDRHTR